MAKKKSSWLPRFEVLIIGIFFMCFVVWAAAKCSRTRTEHRQQEASAEQDTVAALPSPAISMQPLPPAENPIQSAEERIQAIKERYTPLFVTIDGMNMREDPKLSSKILHRLELFEEVIFLNEVTDFTQKISLGDTTTVAPWIKVKHQQGTVGWVYGAGLHYYKVRLEGVVDQ